MCVLPLSASPLATADRIPVALGATCSAWLHSIDIPAPFGTVRLATSNVSVSPAGEVHVADEDIAWDVTSIVRAVPVVRLGVACVSEEGVLCPASLSTGEEVSTPLKAEMPPADPVGAERLHV